MVQPILIVQRVIGLLAWMTAGVAAQGASVDFARMVMIPAGEFWFGCNSDIDTSCESVEPRAVRTWVDSFYIDQYETSVIEYMECVRAGHCGSDSLKRPLWCFDNFCEPHLEFSWSCNWGRPDRFDHPMNCITWDQARDYCAWKGKALATNVEWEKAARGPDDKRVYPWGNVAYEDTSQVANIADEAAGKKLPHWPYARNYDDGYAGTAPIGSYPAGVSPYGVYDMVGNVEEWTDDWYDTTKNLRSMKGASWHRSPRIARISLHYKSSPQSRADYGGIRCVYRPNRKPTQSDSPEDHAQ